MNLCEVCERYPICPVRGNTDLCADVSPRSGSQKEVELYLARETYDGAGARKARMFQLLTRLIRERNERETNQDRVLRILTYAAGGLQFQQIQDGTLLPGPILTTVLQRLKKARKVRFLNDRWHAR